MLTAFGLIGASGAALIPGSFDLVSTTILTSTASSVTFNVSSLASTYKHLQLRMSTSTGAEHSLHLRINGDTGTNYVFGHAVRGNGSAVSSFAYYGSPYNTYMAIGRQYGGSNIFCATVLDLFDAFSSSKYKTAKSFTGDRAESSYEIRLQSSLWMSNSSVTSLTVYNESDANFIAGSRFSIYGIKG